MVGTKRNSITDARTQEVKIAEIEAAMKNADDTTFWKLAEQWQRIQEEIAKREAYRAKPR